MPAVFNWPDYPTSAGVGPAGRVFGALHRGHLSDHGRVRNAASVRPQRQQVGPSSVTGLVEAFGSGVWSGATLSPFPARHPDFAVAPGPFVLPAFLVTARPPRPLDARRRSSRPLRSSPYLWEPACTASASPPGA
jgi:hypothetical protein